MNFQATKSLKTGAMVGAILAIIGAFLSAILAYLTGPYDFLERYLWIYSYWLGVVAIPLGLSSVLGKLILFTKHPEWTLWTLPLCGIIISTLIAGLIFALGYFGWTLDLYLYLKMWLYIVASAAAAFWMSYLLGKRFCPKRIAWAVPPSSMVLILIFWGIFWGAALAFYMVLIFVLILMWIFYLSIR
jgi:hypothetical protein